MRRSFVLLVFALTMALAASSAQAGNQDEANRIARELGQKYPQYNIEVSYQDGKVRLRGEIASDAERQEINSFVSGLPQVQSVQEMLSIAEAEKPAPVSSAVPKPEFFPTKSLPEPNLIDQGRVVSVFAEEPSFPLAEESAADPMVKDTTVKALPALSPAPASPAYAQETEVAPAIPVIADTPAPALQPIPVPVAPAPKAVPVAPAAQAIPVPVAPAPIVAEQHAYEGQNYLPPRGVAIGAQESYAAPQGQAMVPGQNGQPTLPNYAWPTYADYPNYGQVSYPKQYGARSFPYVGPFYPYPQVPLGWRKVTMEWHDGYWWLDFNDGSMSGPFSPLFRQPSKYR